MIDEFEQLMCFAAVCDNGSMTAASKVLGKSKAHVSRQISALEKRLDARLLHRSTRSLQLSKQGTKLRDEILPIYHSTLLVNRNAESLEEALTGRFTITAPVSISSFLLAPEIPALQAQFPKIEFELIPSNENYRLVQQGVDLAIRTGSVKDDNLVAKQIGSARDVFFAPGGVDLCESRLSELADLENERILLHPYLMNDGCIELWESGRSRLYEPALITKIHEFPLILDLVSRGHGIGLAPDYCLENAPQDMSIQPVLTHLQGKSWPVLLVYPFQIAQPQKLTAVSRFLEERIGQRLLKQVV